MTGPSGETCFLAAYLLIITGLGLWPRCATRKFEACFLLSQVSYGAVRQQFATVRSYAVELEARCPARLASNRPVIVREHSTNKGQINWQEANELSQVWCEQVHSPSFGGEGCQHQKGIKSEIVTGIVKQV